MKDGTFTSLKRWLVGISGIGVAICSLILTKQGVGLVGELAWMGTIIALALFCAELLFNSSFDELNWTIILLGLGAYIYSVWTNIEGFYFYRAIEGNLFSNFDVSNLGGGLFMDIYPELAIAWALKESKIGDLLGNIVKTLKDPDKLTEPARIHSQKVDRPVPPSNLPRRMPDNAPGAGKPNFKPQPRPMAEFSQPVKEPTYHPITFMEGDDLPEFIKARTNERTNRTA